MEKEQLQYYLIAGALALVCLLLLLFLFSLGLGFLLWQRSAGRPGDAAASGASPTPSAAAAKDAPPASFGEPPLEAPAEQAAAQPEAAPEPPPTNNAFADALAEPSGGADDIAEPSSSASLGSEATSSLAGEQTAADENSNLPGYPRTDAAEEPGSDGDADAAGDESGSGLAGENSKPNEFFVDPPGDTRFFCVKAQGEAIAFVVDVSPSMVELSADGSQSRLDQLRKELIRTVSELSPKQRFTVIFFNSDPIILSSFVEAKPGPAKVKELDLALQGSFFGQGTSPFRAMEFVLKKKYDVVFLLSDGEFDPLEVDLIRRANRRKTKICTIALGIESANLRQIAEEAEGEYRAVQ